MEEQQPTRAAAAVVRRVCLLVLDAAWLLFVVACAVLLLHAATWRGRAFCLGLGAVVTDLVAWAHRGAPWRFRSRPWRCAWAATLAAGLFVVVALVLAAPSGTGGDHDLRVEHCFANPRTSFPRYRLSNIVPEADQVALGIGLARWLDPLVDGPKARRIRRLALPLYAAMDSDPAFAEIGSAMTWAYAELRGGRLDRGHYVAVLPRKGGRVPAILFLHGSGGNFASYWYALAPLAREHGFAVLCPSFGFGNWDREGGVEAALAALDEGCSRFQLDPQRVYLAALSNGGRGATRLAAQAPGRFRGVVLISAVLERRPIREGAAKGAWRDLPVLLIHGTDDRRVPLGLTLDRLADIQEGGARANTMIAEGEDHFLLFSQRHAVLARIASWVEAQPPTRQPGP